MKLIFKHGRNATAVLLMLSLSACARFDNRMQANGDFDYTKAQLKDPYNTSGFTSHEARNTYAIPTLTDEQKSIGFITKDVDIRPPVQFMSVIEGVLLEKTNDDTTKVWFNAFNNHDDMQAKILRLLTSYLSEKQADIVSNDGLQLETAVFTEKVDFGSFLSKNEVVKQSSYKFSLETKQDGHGVSLTVDALSYAETNDDRQLRLNLVGKTKHDIEIRFINDLLTYAYHINESEALENLDTRPLSIKLGFDDEHQSTWIIDDAFLDAWHKLPALFTLMNFEIVEADRNLGAYLVDFTQPRGAYWEENNLTRFVLDAGEYFVQLGELTDGTTSLTWLDEDKKPLSIQQTTEMYLSIKDYLREAMLENDRQTQQF